MSNFTLTQPTVSRRSFIAGAAATAGIVALGAGMLGSARTVRAEEATNETTADLIVVGAGCAGLAAAAKAAQEGASVIVLEAESATGGTTKISGGHWKFINDDFMSKLPERTDDSDAEISVVLDWDPADFGDYGPTVETLQEQVTEYLASDDPLEFDSVEYWLALHQYYTRNTDLDGNDATTDFDVVSAAYYNQAEIADWLAEGGLTWSDPQPDNRGDGGPLSVEPDGQGMGFIIVLEDMATEAGAQIVLETKATALTTDGGRVTGVIAEDADGNQVTYAANKGVMLACGGFCSNPEMVASEQRLYTGIDNTVPSCEPASCDGTMLLAAQDLGAATANMQFIQFFGFPAAQMLSIEQTIPMAIMGCKFTVDSSGNRFTNDGAAFYGGGNTKDVEVPCNLPGACYNIVTDAAAQMFIGDSYDTYVSVGIVCPGDTIEEAAEAAGLDPAAVAMTTATFNEYCDNGEDPDFGRQLTADNRVETAPFIIVPMAMYGQNTMGGLCINTDGNVVDENGNAIEGLWAAGEICGNMDGGLRRHGDNFAQVLYYGYHCGEQMA